MRRIAIKTIKSALNSGPIKFSLMFSYYDEYFTIEKIDDKHIRIRTELSWGDQYEDGTQEFEDVVSYSEFISFLENRLSEEEKAALSYNENYTKTISMKYLLEEVVAQMRKDIIDKRDERYEKELSKLALDLYRNITTDKTISYTKQLILEEDIFSFFYTETPTDSTLNEFLIIELDRWVKHNKNIYDNKEDEGLHEQAERNLKKLIEELKGEE